MREELGSFEGRHVQVGELRLLGVSTERIGHLDLDEEVLIVAKATVASVMHRDKSIARGGEPMFVRTHRASLSRFFIVPADQGEKWLAEGKALADERFGVQDILTWTEGQDGGPKEGDGGEDQA